MVQWIHGYTCTAGRWMLPTSNMGSVVHLNTVNGVALCSCQSECKLHLQMYTQAHPQAAQQLWQWYMEISSM